MCCRVLRAVQVKLLWVEMIMWAWFGLKQYDFLKTIASWISQNCSLDILQNNLILLYFQTTESLADDQNWQATMQQNIMLNILSFVSQVEKKPFRCESASYIYYSMCYRLDSRNQISEGCYYIFYIICPLNFFATFH